MEVDQEELKTLGFFGIYKEAYKTVFSRRKIFNQITLAFILPLSFIFLAHIEVSHYFLSKIIDDGDDLAETQVGSLKYNKISRLLLSDFAAFCLIKLAYLLFTVIFSLLSTSAVVYTIACIYTSREVTFTKVLTVLPKVWKRLMSTFITTFAVFLAYHIVAAHLLVLWIVLIPPSNAGFLILFILVVFYLGGLVYMSIIWQLANTVSVLEDSCGMEAMKRSKDLIKGKVGVTVFILFKLGVSGFIVQVAFQKLVVHGEYLCMVERAVYAILCLFLLVKLFLLGHVLHTVIYLVCKSYHNENIEKLALSDYLEGYGYQEYVALKGEDAKSGECHV